MSQPSDGRISRECRSRTPTSKPSCRRLSTRPYARTRCGYPWAFGCPSRTRLLIQHTGGNTDTVDIRSLRDDAGFYVPEAITILRTIEESITVPADYVVRRMPGTAYTVTYDSVLGLNPSGMVRRVRGG